MRDQDKFFSIPSNPEEVVKVDAFVDRITDEYSLPAEVSGNIRLSLTEAVVNAIVHGNKEDNTKKVSISLRLQRQKLAISVCDEGKGFNPETVPDPTSVERRALCGGRGIFLMRNLSNRCNFKAGGTQVDLIFNIPSSEK
jgi:serine/threonine-protein kinase RsbW